MTGIETRRAVLVGLAAAAAGLAHPVAATTSRPRVQVVKDPNCGCCAAWIEIMAREGFEMEVYEASYDDLQSLKAKNGIPGDMASCHTARVEGYTIEGHVPPADVHRLLSTRPEAVGLSVPGMPFGSPGMGPETEREAYAVYLILRDGRSKVFTKYDALR